MPFYDALVDSSLKHILVRHEQVPHWRRMASPAPVARSASAWPPPARASNLVTGIADAMLDSVPMVCITGQVGTPLLGTDAFQELDVFGLTMPIVSYTAGWCAALMTCRAWWPMRSALPVRVAPARC